MIRENDEHISDEVRIVEETLFEQLMINPIDLRRISKAVVAALSIKKQRPKSEEK